ncbi:hypothetical protein F5146DRAFT_381733 [Armillaria mellea]|nr:hypothetical protein F5146DRAFT_381733 [Armillaria mellea]
MIWSIALATSNIKWYPRPARWCIISSPKGFGPTVEFRHARITSFPFKFLTIVWTTRSVILICSNRTEIYDMAISWSFSSSRISSIKFPIFPLTLPLRWQGGGHHWEESMHVAYTDDLVSLSLSAAILGSYQILSSCPPGFRCRERRGHLSEAVMGGNITDTCHRYRPTLSCTGRVRDLGFGGLYRGFIAVQYRLFGKFPVNYGFGPGVTSMITHGIYLAI